MKDINKAVFLSTLGIVLMICAIGSVPATAVQAPSDQYSDQDRLHILGSSPTSDSTDAYQPTDNSANQTINFTQELQRTPDEPGEITVTLRYTIPSKVVDLTTRVPTEATVISTHGFVRRDGAKYAWDEQTSNPSVTYRIPVNRTRDVNGPIAGQGDYIFVDPGPWALIRIPPTATSWSWTDHKRVGLSQTTTTDGPGAVGDKIAYLGEYREVNRTANGQTFRLIIPTEANLAESPTDILDSLASASNSLQVGDPDDTVFMVAAPTQSTKWGVRGLQAGDADLWVRDFERLDRPGNTWLHEYVHTRQSYTAGSETRWFTEASASYYAALLTLEQDLISFSSFQNRLSHGHRPPDSNAVLADPATWDTFAPYTKGALVSGEMDRQIRLATNQTRSLQDVFSRMNRHEGTVTKSDFQDLVRRTGGDGAPELADQYTTTQDAPLMWNHTEHTNAFGTTPPRIGYALSSIDDHSGYRVSGPYRTGPVGSDRPIRLVVGETLEFDVQTTNTGGKVGEYNVQVFVNGEGLDRQTGTLEAGESHLLAFSHRFPKAGEYTVSVGGDRVGVSVRDPGYPTVTEITATPRTRRHGNSRFVSIAATVRNEQSIPASANLTLFQNDHPIETRHVNLAPAEEKTVTYNESLVEPGEHVFRIENRTTEIRVTPTKTPTQTTVTSEDGSGLGAVLIVFWVLIAGLVRRQ